MVFSESVISLSKSGSQHKHNFVTFFLSLRCSDPTVTCYRFLDLSGPLYVGGMPEGNRAKQFRIKSQSFNGCMKDFFVDNELMDFGRYMTNSGTEPGCQHLQEACNSRPCVNSKRCTNIWNGYQCDCNDGYAGKNCSDGKLFRCG